MRSGPDSARSGGLPGGGDLECAAGGQLDPLARNLPQAASRRSPAAPGQLAGNKENLEIPALNLPPLPDPRRLRRHLAVVLAGIVLLVSAGAVVAFVRHLPPGATPYLPICERWGRRYGLAPDFLAAVIEAESAGRPQAVSCRGAVGVMQLLPATAEALARRIGYHGPLDLTDPETNIRLGAFYLVCLARSFDYDPHLTLAAYNAGPGHVSRWVRCAPGLAGEEILQRHGFPATRRYVEKVLQTYRERGDRHRK